jgi:hypothetical protein
MIALAAVVSFSIPRGREHFRGADNRRDIWTPFATDAAENL